MYSEYRSPRLSSPISASMSPEAAMLRALGGAAADGGRPLHRRLPLLLLLLWRRSSSACSSSLSLSGAAVVDA